MADSIAIEERSDGRGLTAEIAGGTILHSLTVALRLGESRDVVLGLADRKKYFRRRDKEFAPPKNAYPSFSVEGGDTLVVEYPTGREPDNLIFFNLKGHGVGDIEDHNLTIYADRFVDEMQFSAEKKKRADGIGDIRGWDAADVFGTPEARGWDVTDVSGTPEVRECNVMDISDTPLDFREETPIGERMRVGFAPLTRKKGYDHIFVLRQPDERGFDQGNAAELPLTHAATLTDRMRTLQMDVYTSFPCLHLYTGNRMSGRDIGKGGCIYPKRGGVALMPCDLPGGGLLEGHGKKKDGRRMEYRFKSLI